MYQTNRNDCIEGWLFAIGSAVIGYLLLIDRHRFVSAPAWQVATEMANHDSNIGRLILGVTISILGFGMAAVLLMNKLVWLPFITASVWFCYITVALMRSTFEVGSGTPGFVVWGLVALALMNFGVKHLPKSHD